MRRRHAQPCRRIVPLITLVIAALLAPVVSPARASARAGERTAQEPARPVLLVGGTFTEDSYFYGPYNDGDTVVSWLENLGYDVYTMGLARDPEWPAELDEFLAFIAEEIGYRPGDIGGAGTARILPTDDGTPSSGVALADKVDEILDTTGAAQVDIIGHSQAASVARWYGKTLGVGKVGTMVSLGGGEWGLDNVPVGCSPPFRMGVCEDMVMTDGVETPFLQQLNDENPLPPGVHYYHFWGSDDKPGVFTLDLVSPPNEVDSGMRLPGAISRGAYEVCPGHEVFHVDEWVDPVMQDMMVAALQGNDIEDFESSSCPDEEPFESCVAPCSLEQVVEFDVAGDALTMAQAGPLVSMEPVTLDGAPGATAGQLHEVTVTDRRGDGAGWNVTGQVTDFTVDPELGECSRGDETSEDFRCIPGDNLGWTPVALAAHDAVPGDVAVAASGSSLAEGLGSAAQTLCSAPPTQSGGRFGCGAGLSLATPASAAAGTYSATLTLTLA